MIANTTRSLIFHLSTNVKRSGKQWSFSRKLSEQPCSPPSTIYRSASSTNVHDDHHLHSLLLPTTTTTTDDEEYHRHIINCKHCFVSAAAVVAPRSRRRTDTTSDKSLSMVNGEVGSHPRVCSGYTYLND